MYQFGSDKLAQSTLSEQEARIGMAAVQCGLDMLSNSFLPRAVRAVPADVIVLPLTDFTKDSSG